MNQLSISTELPKADQERLERIRQETEAISFSELAMFFAQGKVVYIHPEVDLVSVAFHMHKNNKGLIDDLMTRRWIEKMPDPLAKKWFDDKIRVMASVVDPWVLVQPIEETNKFDCNGSRT